METLRSLIEFFASYPLPSRFLLIGGLGVTILTLFFSPRAAPGLNKADDVRIESPRGGDRVSWTFPVVGHYEELSPDIELWIITTDALGQRYWPQERAITRKDKTWSGHVKGIGGETGTRRTFGVFRVGRDGQALLNLWESASKTQPALELARLTQDIRKLHEVDVVVGSGRPQK